ncbi:polysaccharide deacetylase family protein [Streptomyces sp. NBC_00536]|uniref:polysaccharide deacetylase family protein n=1 Tax=Streptomyces sp. NBC_00536 TaxID=2975769 RepID=UPI002E80FFA2|nr:polysaccharide deacetylase family protein [Streptomyces sp. NBC_00536]WUC79697.1 polysaccharide deacetylase family protein [Streptomyces sp. NBC_00536]
MWRSRVVLGVFASLSLTFGVAGSAVAGAGTGTGTGVPVAAAVSAADGVGLPPVVAHVPTSDKVVFITIDDGWNHDPAAARTLIDKRVPVTLFLLPGATSYDTGYFTDLIEQGRATVENHTVNHPDLTTLDAAGKDAEVCGAREQLKGTFGRAPQLLRPPYGAVNDDVRLAAKACGAKALVTWTHDVTTWSETPPTPKLQAGDIVLLHFTPTLEADLERALGAAKAAGLKPAALMPQLKAAGLV